MSKKIPSNEVEREKYYASKTFPTLPSPVTFLMISSFKKNHHFPKSTWNVLNNNYINGEKSGYRY